MSIQPVALPRSSTLLADAVPLPRVWRNVVLVTGAALLTAAAAQVVIHLSWTPVPITGQTFAVLLAGGTLGWRLGAASQALYLALGATGLPFYADGEGGWEAATGSTLGYFVGFVLAAALVGRLAEEQMDRRLLTSIPAMLAGTAVIYTCGATWLAYDLGVPTAEAVELGVAPFLIGDAIKFALAGALMPAAWRLTRRGN